MVPFTFVILSPASWTHLSQKLMEYDEIKGALKERKRGEKKGGFLMLFPF